MNGIGNLVLNILKYSFTCDVSKLIKYLRSIPNEINQRLSQKLITLLAILCGQHFSEMLSVTETYSDAAFRENS